jgi:hypothetical protein
MVAGGRLMSDMGAAFVSSLGVKYDKAVDCLIKDRDALLAFYLPGRTGSTGRLKESCLSPTAWL